MERHNRHNTLEPFRDEGRTRGVRTVLNVLFMLGALAGIACYFYLSRQTGTYIMLGSIVLKFVELTLRIAKL